MTTATTGHAAGSPHNASMTTLTIAAVGVVYGDIGTSPLYTLKEVFTGGYGLRPDDSGVLGILSLIFWSLVWVVTLKYVLVVLRADNQGEGGIMALTALARRGVTHRHLQLTLVMLGLAGAALLYGDSMITPAISVLSAVEGIEVAYPPIAHWVVPVALGILIALFVIQQRGTATVGKLFGPITLLWFASLAALGVYGISQAPQVLAAVNPLHALELFRTNPGIGIIIFSSVVLAITGAEALYADMGHFGRRPIARAWLWIVLPALVLNYFGQGALLLQRPEAISNPFYLLAPDWALWPMVILATVATIIASQAVITGAYSMTYQAIQFGFIPRMRVFHTSSAERGQIYIPTVNWLLMAGVVALVLGFESSTSLAAAYGIAVTGTMLITSLLLSVVMIKLWRWPLWAALPLLTGFVLVDALYFSANIAKLFHGGAFPVLAGIVLFTLMSTWWRGRALLEKRVGTDLPLEGLINSLRRQPPHRVSGTAVFLSGRREVLPRALLHNLMHNQVLHERIIIVTVENDDRPWLAGEARVQMETFEDGFYRAIIHFGYMETNDVPQALCAFSRSRESTATPFPFEPMKTTWFLSRETLVSSPHVGMARWRERLFSFMLKSAHSNMQFFHLPPNRVVELGSQVEV
ncbi:KUP system potassium uptake protein [Kushneria avicenniae]|uniref:Probable potassium transport system protein Kup n=1 Tax=Kushneria avicenniae TaxID=402385 RepID=A0A1I1M2Y3_9GAMM|nr:potassium transporter Kup [Kushneria avicenniae]SFC79416.1 KUP system potassium uptake protein [Kushneria avicenniae]